MVNQIGFTNPDNPEDVWTQRRLALLASANQRLRASPFTDLDGKSLAQSQDSRGRIFSSGSGNSGNQPNPSAISSASGMPQPVMPPSVSSATGAPMASSPGATGSANRYPGGSTGGSHKANSTGDKYKSGYFFSPYDDAAMAELVDDHDKQAYLYGGFKNPQGQTNIASMLGNVANPEALMLAMGYQSPFDSPGASMAKTQQLWDQMLGGSPGEYINPGQLIANVLREVKGMGNMTGQKQGSELQSRIGTTIGNPRATAEAVNNTIEAALYGFMPGNSYAALMSQLNRARMDYDDMAMRNPGGQLPNYADFIQQRLGINLGVGLG